MDPAEALFYIMLGLAVSTIASIAGIGGGVFMVPILYHIGLPINAAIGTSKTVIVFVSTASTASYLRRGKVNLKVGLPIMISGTIGSYIGAYLVPRVPQAYLKTLIAAFILYYSLRLIYKYFKKEAKPTTTKTGNDNEKDIRLAYAGILGMVVGIMAGLTGTGGGALLMPVLTGVLKIPIHEAVATSMFIMTLGAATATIRHALNGDIIYSIALPMAAGALVGASLIGPRIALKMKPSTLRLTVGVILLIVAIRMLIP